MTVSAPPRPVVVALVLSLLLAGCGGGGVEAKDWAADVCGSWQQLSTRLQKAVKKLQADMADPEASGEAVVSYLTSLENGFERMEADLEKTGVPDVQNGAQVREQLLEAVSSTRQAFARARESAQSRDMSDPAVAMKVFADLNKDTKEMLEARNKVKSPELRQAFQQDPACDSLPA